MPKTVPMSNPETGKTADVHPDEVANWQSTGWRLSETPVLPPPPIAAPPVAPEKPASSPEKPKLTLPKKD